MVRAECLLDSEAFLCSLRPICFKFLNSSFFTSNLQRGKQGAFILIQTLWSRTHASIMYLRFFIRHSVVLYRNRILPFNIPKAFSVTTRALHNFLLKSLSIGSCVPSLKTLTSQECRGNAESPIVTSGMLPGLPNDIPLFGSTPPARISWYIFLFRRSRESWVLPGAPTAQDKRIKSSYCCLLYTSPSPRDS